MKNSWLKPKPTKILKENILDLCYGGGEVSNMFCECDADFYESNTNSDCIPMTFRDIAQNGIEKQCDFVICSYAMHLF